MMRKYLTLGALSSGLALSIITVRAAEPLSSGSPGSAAGAEAAAIAAADFNRPARATMVPPSGSPILLEAGKGTLIRLPRPASTVFVANPETADVQIKSPSLIYVTAKAPGQTSLYAVDAEDRMLLNAPVRVEHDLSRVRQTLGAVAPGENVSVSSVDNALVLSGNVSSAGRAERVRSLAAAIARETKGDVVNRMSVATPNQVSIRIKVAEVNRQVLKTLGVNWNKLAGDHIRFFTNNPTAVAGNLAGQLAIGFGAASWFTAATVDALAQEGLVNLLAEPNLTATNGQPASFLAGGEFPVPVASASQGGVTTVTIEFKKFGVSLDVTPTIVDADHLSLRVRSEVSQIDRANGVVSQQITIPGLTVRRAETTVELGSGQSFMLAGLLQNTDSQNVSKVPALGDIPVLGQLFRSEQFQRNESELVLIVTPYLVNPAPNVASLATPVDGMRAPHDIQKFVHGSMYRQGLPAPAKGPVDPGGRAVIGPVGFRLD